MTGFTVYPYSDKEARANSVDLDQTPSAAPDQGLATR